MNQKPIRLISSTALFTAAILSQHALVSLLLFIAAYIIIGWDILWKAFRHIIRGNIFDENFLMTVATIGAFAIQEYPEAVAVMLLYQTGEYFQDRAVGRSRKSISSLMNIRPQTATVEQDGTLQTISLDAVNIGTVIVIKPGERIPLDGVVLEGNSTLDASVLTGESLPLEVERGTEVLSGCINLSAPLRITVTKRSEDSTVSKILDLIQHASEHKAKTETFITRFARVYTPVVCIAAVLLAVIPPLALHQAFSLWVERALSFLVVSCPCALVISVPLSFFGGIGGASRNGILIKGSNYLEQLSHADTVVFDKTGTLTEGAFRVTSIHPQSMPEDQLLQLAATLEYYSTHPIAKSLLEHNQLPLDPNSLQNIRELQGYGIAAERNNHQYLIGNTALMNQHEITIPVCPHAGVIVHVAEDKKYLGHIEIADTLKHNARSAVNALYEQGIQKTVLLTGDRFDIAQQTADLAGLDVFYADLLPSDKVSHVETLLRDQHVGSLVFVGDGINDAPSLARADVGIAMGALGSDAAIDAADIVLMDDNPRKIAEAIHLAKRTMRIARQNIVFALTVKVLVLVLASFSITSLWMAVFADVGVSILAVLNASRTLVSNPAETE